VNDSLAVPGSLLVTALDAATGIPLVSLCAQTPGTMFASVCTDDGTAEFPEIGAGTYAVTFSDGDHLDSAITGGTGDQRPCLLGDGPAAARRHHHGRRH
jgi:hypothetical protein